MAAVISLIMLFALLVPDILRAGSLGTYASPQPEVAATPGLPDLLSQLGSRGLRMAIVKPVFTATAYSSFYFFFHKHAHTKRNETVRSDLHFLNASIVDDWGWARGLYNFVISKEAGRAGLQLGKNIWVISDIDIDRGALFDAKGERQFDLLILGFEEYVTAREYYDIRRFVASGGFLLVMDATTFLAEVMYWPRAHRLSLVRGHGWSFNGTAARPDVYSRWRDENANWLASDYCCYDPGSYTGALLAIDANTTNPIIINLYRLFGPRVFLSYHGHEENRLLNMSHTTIIAVWQRHKPHDHDVIAAYLHVYQKGLVIHFGAMASDVIEHDRSVQAFLVQSIRYAHLLSRPGGAIREQTSPGTSQGTPQALAVLLAWPLALLQDSSVEAGPEYAALAARDEDIVPSRPPLAGRSAFRASPAG
ncbi:MAG: hypothetical protein C4339_04285 [Nitrososphaerota archaeon]